MEPFVLLQIASGPVHGYEVAQSIGALGFRRAAEDPSILYKLLRTFEDEGTRRPPNGTLASQDLHAVSTA